VGRLRDGANNKGHLRLTLNGQPLFQLGTLDQGWWPDGLLTPPSDAAQVEPCAEVTYAHARGFLEHKLRLKQTLFEYQEFGPRSARPIGWSCNVEFCEDIPTTKTTTLFEYHHALRLYLSTAKLRCMTSSF
jgi:hypothetical protein